MSAGWVAGSVRARALARRRMGSAAARQMASCGSLDEALHVLAGTPAGHAMRARSLAAVQHMIAEALLWDLRVLAGWLPQGGAQFARTLAGWFEIANVAERMQELSGRPSGQIFRLGALATAWPQLRQAASLADLRAALTASAWKDPGGATEPALAVGMRARWADRVTGLGDPARTWAASAVVLLLAGERFTAGRPLSPVLRSTALTLLGPHAAAAGTLDELAVRLPSRLAWVLEPVRSPADLWQAEAAWWARTERDGLALLAGSGLDRRAVLGAVAVLAADARRVSAALEIAARGGGSLEVFDAVA